MRYLGWLIKFLVFVLLLTLAMQNSAVTQFHLFMGQSVEAPLILILLVFFAIGVATGLSAGFFYSLRLRRELTALKKELRARQQAASGVVHDPSDVLAD